MATEGIALMAHLMRRAGFGATREELRPSEGASPTRVAPCRDQRHYRSSSARGFGEGGGIRNYQGNLTLANTTVSYNSAGNSGDMLNKGMAELVNAIIAGNTAPT